LQAIEARYPEYIPGRWDSEGTTGADIHALIAEVRNLRTKLDAVPVNSIYKLFFELFGQYERGPVAEAIGAVGEWLSKQAVQP